MQIAIGRFNLQYQRDAEFQETYVVLALNMCNLQCES